MKKSIIMALSMLVAFCANAQNDSSAFFSGNWSSEKICDGITLRQCAFNGNLFNSDQYVSVLEISGRKTDIVEAPEESLVKTSQMAQEENAIVAVNGGFFKMRKPFGSVMFLRIDGQDKAPNKDDTGSSTGFGKRSTRQSGAVAVYGDELFIVKADAVKDWERYIQAEDVLTSGPLMIVDGKDEVIPAVSFNTYRHPRTAVGKKDDGTVVYIVVDGRSKGNAAGMSITELQSVMRWLGCKDALNLDGGGSSAMVVEGKVVNHTCDNGKFDNQGERKVSNALIVRR